MFKLFQVMGIKDYFKIKTNPQLPFFFCCSARNVCEVKNVREGMVMPAVKGEQRIKRNLQALLSLQQLHYRFMLLNIFQIITQIYAKSCSSLGMFGK
jgi:hypothetical protein